MIAVAVMAIILVTQFNSLFQAFLILTAVVFSTGGVFLGHLIMDKPFGTVMSGVGVITLAGIVVNNNIVFIDTYNVLRKRGADAYEGILRTCAVRLRPHLLCSACPWTGPTSAYLFKRSKAWLKNWPTWPNCSPVPGLTKGSISTS